MCSFKNLKDYSFVDSPYICVSDGQKRVWSVCVDALAGSFCLSLSVHKVCFSPLHFFIAFKLPVFILPSYSFIREANRTQIITRKYFDPQKPWLSFSNFQEQQSPCPPCVLQAFICLFKHWIQSF